jgi:hypothetical protein
MPRSHPPRALLGAAILLASLAAAALPAAAQTPPVQATPLPAVAPAPAPAQAPAQAPAPADPAMEQRIRALQAQLNITTDQLPQWTIFAQTMRANAQSTDALFRQRASAAASMNALENMQSYAVTARQYADNTQALATAFAALYGSLTPAQKQAADTLFRQQATQNAAARKTR